MEIELFNGSAKAIIDPRGAWLTNLSDDYGDILYPKRTLLADDGAKKARGGSHVCLPNFGPGGDSGQPQHGFGRLMDWEVTDTTATSAMLTLAHGDKDYSGLSALLTYQLEHRSMIMTLELTNDGDTDLRVAPAFHPYFSTIHDGESILINGEKQLVDEFAEAEFTTGTEQQLETKQCTVSLESQQLMTWAVWTDNLAPYICVEPTLDGFAFLKETPTSNEILHPGQVRVFAATIAWNEK